MLLGNIELRDKPLFLAPMEDVSEHHFRLICKGYGADFLYTEFISADGLVKNIKSFTDKMILYDDELPIGIQLYGSKIDTMVEAAMIAEQANPQIIDLNFGCPVKKIANKGGGSGMLRDIPKLIEMTDQVIKSVNIPVTVKTRLGWDENNLVIVDLAERLQDIGVQGLTIHGRTREQMYTGEADWTLIGEIKNNPRMKIPIIGNGDVDSGEKAKLMFDRYGVDGIMIGRASIGNPYIFKEIRHYLETGKKLPELVLKEQIDNLKYMISQSIKWKGETSGIIGMRRHMAKKFNDLPDFRPLRIQMLRSETKDKLWETFDEIKNKYSS